MPLACKNIVCWKHNKKITTYNNSTYLTSVSFYSGCIIESLVNAGLWFTKKKNNLNLTKMGN